MCNSKCSGGKRFGLKSLNLTTVCSMKKLVVALMSLVAVAFATGSGFAAEKPGTAPVKAETKAKPATSQSAQTKTDAGKTEAGKKADAATPAAGAQAGAATEAKPEAAPHRHHGAPTVKAGKSKHKARVHAKHHRKAHLRHHRHHAHKHAVKHVHKKHVKSQAHVVQTKHTVKNPAAVAAPKKDAKPAAPKKDVQAAAPKKDDKPAEPKKDIKK